ncbi:hypothetical protein [Methanoculleus sp. MH98A]|nr:hypothetical protein [Methanoculleus sp. MH98A]
MVRMRRGFSGHAGFAPDETVSPIAAREHPLRAYLLSHPGREK